MSNDPIREAVHHLVAAAPPPSPLPATAPAPLPPPRSYRWVAIAGSAVIVAGGAVAIAAWPSGETEAPVVSESTASVAPSISAAPSTTAPSTVPDTTQPGPASTSTPSTQPPESIPVTTTPPGLVNDYQFELPPGQLALGPDDLVVAHLDGDLYLYPGALSDSPGEPQLLVDMDDPRAEPEEGPGPNVIDGVAGPVNGSLIYGTCCEPVSGNLWAVADAGSERTPLAPGYWPVLSPDGSRLATLNFYSFEVWDLASGVRTSREIDTDPQLLNTQQLVWSRDGSSLFTLRFDEQGWQMVRISADPPFSVTGVIALDGVGSPINSSDTARLLGTDPDGMLVVHVRSTNDDRLVSFDPVTMAVEDGVWSRLNEDPVVQFALSPDGTRMLEWTEASVDVRQPDGVSSQVLAVGARQAWFVS